MYLQCYYGKCEKKKKKHVLAVECLENAQMKETLFKI